MRLRFKMIFLVMTVIFGLSLVILPAFASPVQAATRQITITITEAQFTRYVKAYKPSDAKSIAVDIVDGGIIIKMSYNAPNAPYINEHYGVLIRDGKIVTEFGVLDYPGIGAFGYDTIKKALPQFLPNIDHDTKITDRFVQQQIRLKAGTKYTPVSVTIGNDKIVIIVSK